MKDFTKKQIKKYIENPTVCPNCNHDTVKVEKEFIEETMSREIYCEECGIAFNEIYTLVTIKLKQ